MFFNSIKEINMSRNEINWLLGKGMSNIYLKECLISAIEKKWCTQNFNFKSLKSSSPAQFLGSSTSHIYHWIFKLLVAS